jgi:DNA-binding GntR family transcriptional regulator
VGSGTASVRPLRGDIRALDLQISGEIDEALQSRGTWELVYDRVEAEVTSCLIFGEFRIVETELGDHLGVSRTVVRDVLSRLHERGLIRKNQSSHWIAGPLTAQAVRDKLALRAILEPAALRLAAGGIDYAAVEALRSRLAAGEELDGELLETGLMEHCLAKVPNGELAGLIRNNQLLLTAANQALTLLGLPRDRVEHGEYLTLFDLISRHLIDSAAEYLEGQLRVMAEKSLARLKIVAIINQSTLHTLDVFDFMHLQAFMHWKSISGAGRIAIVNGEDCCGTQASSPACSDRNDGSPADFPP